jgi:hypothetical protein
MFKTQTFATFGNDWSKDLEKWLNSLDDCEIVLTQPLTADYVGEQGTQLLVVVKFNGKKTTVGDVPEGCVRINFRDLMLGESFLQQHTDGSLITDAATGASIVYKKLSFRKAKIANTPDALEFNVNVDTPVLVHHSTLKP